MRIAHEVRGVVSHMLGDARSTIDPDVAIWTADVAKDLQSRVQVPPKESTGSSQWDKLDVQLEGAPRAVVLLAAELVFLREQPVRTALPTTRRDHVERVLSRLEGPYSVPDSMVQSLRRPSDVAGFIPGQSYNGALWRHITWIAAFVQQWAALPEKDREAGRRDPWELQQHMVDAGTDQADIRNALQFLVAPDTFEPIPSARMKKTIRDGLRSRIDGPSGDGAADIDRDLYAIRATLAHEINGTFDFWSPGVIEQWHTSTTTFGHEDDIGGERPEDPAPREPRYWLYSPGTQASAWPEFSTAGLMGLGWDRIGDLAQYPTREAIRDAIDVENTGARMSNDVLALWQFEHDMAPGDVVYAKRGRREVIGRGIVRSAPWYDPDRETLRHLRKVEWTHRGSWPQFGDARLHAMA